MRQVCEANVYMYRGAQEELVMEKVDRIIPGEDQTIFLESIFGERKVLRARIKEMELVHHRVVLEEIREQPEGERHEEIWLQPDTDHGHFHEGEEVKLLLFKGYNMQPSPEQDLVQIKAIVAHDGKEHEVPVEESESGYQIRLNHEAGGLLQVYALESCEMDAYATVLWKCGHHHHHGLKPLGLPLEIFPSDYSHARMGQSYEIQVLKEGKPLAGAEVRVTYASTRQKDYPHRLVTDQEGRASIFLTARGNYLFSVSDGNLNSTFTLVKSF